jgi:hypothetical protein
MGNISSVSTVGHRSKNPSMMKLNPIETGNGKKNQCTILLPYCVAGMDRVQSFNPAS